VPDRIVQVVTVEVAEEFDLGAAVDVRVGVEDSPDQACAGTMTSADDDRPCAARHANPQSIQARGQVDKFEHHRFKASPEAREVDGSYGIQTQRRAMWLMFLCA